MKTKYFYKKLAKVCDFICSKEQFFNIG
ncbi:hypothetical protein A1S_3650 [Acinetobacter baumannii ATCC 17978]|nr:hypothetical protein A1S_3650 [Acinetobacter baumannii ATCC 17978]